MTAVDLSVGTLPKESPADSVLLRVFRRQVDEFFRMCDERADTWEQLQKLGRLVRMSSSHPDFPDKKLALAVESKCRLIDLEIEAAAMTETDADAILSQAGLV